MQYRVVFREITPEDLDRNCMFMPDEGSFDMYLRAIAQDASWLDGVDEVNRDGSHAIIVTTDATIDGLKEQFVPLLQNHWAHLRFSSFDPYDGSQA